MTDAVPVGQPRIVVGIDGSDQSANALRWAAHLARIFATRLEAVIAWEYPTSFGWATVPEDWDPPGEMRRVVEGVVQSVFGSEPPAALIIEVREGGPAKVLLDASAGATMLVVGSRGHGGFAGLLLGSVSANVAEHATCPVLIIHGNQPLPAAT
jgi:nucleotide-binding universal stress UspA family protein